MDALFVVMYFPSCLCNHVGFQALIQYQSRQSAVAARTALQVFFKHPYCFAAWMETLFEVCILVLLIVERWLTHLLFTGT